MPLLLQALLPSTLPSSSSLLNPSLSKNAPFSCPHRFSALKYPSSRRLLRCSLVSVSTEVPPTMGEPRGARLSPAEVSRTIMELSSTGTLSTLTPEGWPLGIGARFVVDARGAPALCLSQPDSLFGIGGRASFHVQFEQSGSRTPQCTLLGSLSKPDDELLLRKLRMKWEKQFGEQVNGELVYLMSIERVLHMEDFKENGVWVACSEYMNADPDPLRDFAEKIVEEMNLRHAEDVQRLCNVFVDSGFQVMGAKMIWVDRLGFDMHFYSEKGVFAARIPFPREVADEKGVKSSFNSMSHLAWEVEKNYVVPDFEKVTCLKKIM
ncbi:glutamyl-tRNA reductase-binding protein, chloroplastic isoform X2 [Phoenix dactylifera]|uniref:Glutamyl-tRNA reductase-binding protein, chloroplastic isoform X2 n=1 Tax=Phoenix dactylifera TaxID=42345 RepID=A0A8B7MTX8_PHODC|nr:glutamyl-tRNA reductase-binding protein, chloroplastic isoform X2 [Phoenix dactylifera]